MEYIEIAEGNVSNRNKIIPKEKLPQYIETARKKKAELYSSIWIYDDTIVEHFKLYKTIRSFRGKVSFPDIIFDIDKGKDTDAFVLRRTQEFIRKLEQDWDVRPEELTIYYSGRGYHIYMPDYFKFGTGEHVRQEVKNTIKEHFPEVDLAIYGATGLIRAPYSYNMKSDRFKIPLSPTELFSSEAKDIIKLAESNELRSIMLFLEVEERDFSKYKVLAVVEREAVGYRDEPTRKVTCMQHLFNKGCTKERHNELMRLVSSWRRQGLAKKASTILAIEWASTLEEYEVKRAVDSVYNDGYVYGCNDVVMRQYCDPKCIYFQYLNYGIKASSPDDLEALLVANIEGMSMKKYVDLKAILGLDIPYRIYESEFVIFTGDAKIGKSMLVQNIVVQSDSMKWLYFSLENGNILDSRRFVQIEHSMTKPEVYKYYADGGTGLFDKLSHIQMVDTSVTVSDLKKLIVDSECDGVVIDTVDQILTPNITNYTAITEHLAVAFTNISKATKTIFLAIHHISKNAAQDEDGKAKEMTIHSLKGSSALEQKADKVISIEGKRDENARIIRSLGARDEAPFVKTLFFDKDRFQLKKIDE